MVRSSRGLHAEQILKTATAYEILGVRPGASLEEIMTAYRMALHAIHPDGRKTGIHPDGRKTATRPRFTVEAVRAAFEILRNPATRRQYDEGLTRARTLARRAQILKAINDNAHAAGNRTGGFMSRIGAIFWPFQKD